PQQILYAINNKLNALLPTGMFLAVALLKIDHRLDHITVINCGMPDGFLVDPERRRIKQRISSQALPLGIEADVNYKEATQFIPIETGDRVILVSDGVTEARNADGEYFGKQRLIESITGATECAFQLDQLAQDLDAFCKNAPQDDDISAVEVLLTPALMPGPEQSESAQGNEAQLESLQTQGPDDCVELSLALRGTQLRRADPVPILINHIQEIAGLHQHRRQLFTILTELYVNALDHGILRLDSSLKQGDDGFSSYYRQREQRLQSLTEGEIRIELHIYGLHSGGYIVIRVEDSGRGFDIDRQAALKATDTHFSGRGIKLVL
ncbi:MAG: SpoIIE family protein phosphatase, partial [Candidatus Thiodiazotropha sp.]